jgi:hypothetical protein
LNFFKGNKEGFQLLVNNMDIDDYPNTVHGRVCLGIELMKYVPSNTPDLVRAALGQDPLDSTIASVTNAFGATLLHAVADSIGFLTAMQHIFLKQCRVLPQMPNKDIIKEEYSADLQGEFRIDSFYMHIDTYQAGGSF